MSLYLLDTNHLGILLDEESSLRHRVIAQMVVGNRFGTCVPVLCEIQTGIEQTARRDENQKLLAAVLRRIRVWPLDVPVSHLYARIYLDLKARGRVLSQVDMMLAALARSMNATLLTSDRDFEAVPGLRVENWLA